MTNKVLVTFEMYDDAISPEELVKNILNSIQEKGWVSKDLWDQVARFEVEDPQERDINQIYR
jgi:hypothetical protein